MNVRIRLLLPIVLGLASCTYQAGVPPVVDRSAGGGGESSTAVDVPRSAKPSVPAEYVVQSGDTLYGIAWRFGLDYQTLAGSNGIAPPYRILVGQRLQLATTPPVAASGGYGSVAGGGALPAGVPLGAPPVTEMIPPEPSARGFEYVPDNPAASQTPAGQNPPVGSGSDAGAYGTVGPLPSQPVLPAASQPVVPMASQPGVPTAPQPILPAAAQAETGSGVSSENAAPPVVSAPTGASGTVAAAEAPVKVPQPVPEPAAPAPVTPTPAGPTPVGKWRWPAPGKIQKGFGNGSKGVDFRLEATQPVVAAGGGEVVYAGNGLGGFRHLVIVKHDRHYLSAYSLNRSLVVREGDRVSSGATIAAAEPGGAAGTLRFEIRRDGQPVNPTGVIGR